MNRVITRRGIYLHENLDLEQLSADRAYEFLFAWAPLKLVGATGDLRVAAHVCDRIAVMQRGVIVEPGTTSEVFTAPRHEYTKALFDAAPGRNREFFGRHQA